MKTALNAALVILWLLPAVLLAGDTAPAVAAQQAWTLAEAEQAVTLNPKDTYLQYVALQLARRAKQLETTAAKIENLTRPPSWRDPGRRAEVDLFNVFSGALAVQESLQLDTMRGQPRASSELKPDGLAQVSKLRGPEVKSHPWEQMLAGRKPELSALCRCVPSDFYLVEFRSLNKLLEAMDVEDLWGTHLLNQATHEAVSRQVGERLKQQLAVETSLLLRPFYDLVVEEVAVTGSDLYVREGSDVTLLFQIKQPEIFKARMDSFLANAEKAHPNASRTVSFYREVECIQLSTPDRVVNVCSAYPAPNLHLRGNSLTALQRVIDAIKGADQGGRGVQRLGDTPEFAYIRTLLPRGALEEDGFVYLSDPFIRRQVSAPIKLTERRRMICYNHLRMIGHASLLYRTEFGKLPASLAELVRAQCAPADAPGAPAWRCPDGGTYLLNADSTGGICSIHGHALMMTPCCELPLTEVSAAEAAEYDAFVADYNQYWRTFFDPIALRIQLTPQRYRLETIVLPLIDNSVYTGLARVLGGPAEALDALPVPKRNIFSAAVRLNKEELIKTVGGKDADLSALLLDLFPREVSHTAGQPMKVREFFEKGLGNQVGFHVCDASPTFDLNMPLLLGNAMASFNGAQLLRSDGLAFAFVLSSLNTPSYLSFSVQDAKVVDRFLADIDTVLAQFVRQPKSGGWFNVSYDFTLLPGNADAPARAFSVELEGIKWRFFWARIGQALYITSKPALLDDLAAAERAAAENRADGSQAHAQLRLRPENWKECLPDFRLGWSENNRKACLTNVAQLSSVARAYLAAVSPDPNKSADEIGAQVHQHADKLYGAHFFCPESGKYCLADDGKSIVCSVHGSALHPRQPVAPAEGGALGALLRNFSGMTTALTFLEDGLHAVVTIDRKPME